MKILRPLFLAGSMFSAALAFAQTPPPGSDDFTKGLAAYQANDFITARTLWLKAAEQGNATALFNLGIMSKGGQGTPKDYAAARSWYQKALAKGAAKVPAALVELDGLEAFDRGYAAYKAQNMAGAEKEWLFAAEKGNASAMVNLGVLAVKKEGGADYATAAVWYKKAADKGNKQAAESLKKIQPYLVGVEEFKQGDALLKARRYQDALPVLLKAGELGNIDAWNALGRIYNDGLGTSRDYDKAIAWYQKAADTGDVMAGIMVDSLKSTADLMRSSKQMAEAKAKIDGVFSGNAAAGKQAGGGKQINPKGSPWTYEQMLAALNDGADQTSLANAVQQDTVSGLYVTDFRRLRSLAPGGIDEWGRLNEVLGDMVIMGPPPWALDLAKASVAQREKTVARLPAMVDSAALRARVAARDPAAMLELWQMPQEKRTLGDFPKEITSAEMDRVILEKKYVRGYWRLAEGLTYQVDKTKEDPSLAMEYLQQSAEAGDPTGAFKLAQRFLAAGETGAENNYLEAEYWFTVAAARGPDGLFGGPYAHPVRDLAFLYVMKSPTGGPNNLDMSFYSEPPLRWAHEMLRRGGQLADAAEFALKVYADFQKKPRLRAEVDALAAEQPRWTAAEKAAVEKSADAGDVTAMLKLAEAFAQGRGVHQRDALAVKYFQRAMAKGSAVAARALIRHYEFGYGVRKDPAQALALFTKAAELGDNTAWREIGYILQFGKGVKEDYAAARAAYEKGLAAGDARAASGLSILYAMGRGVPVDKNKEIELLTLAANAGSKSDMSSLAYALTKQNKYKEAAGWYRKVVEGGDASARVALADALNKSGEKAEAVTVYRLAVAEGAGSQAIYSYANLLEQTGDKKEALKQYRAVAADLSDYNFFRDPANADAKRIEEELNPKPGSVVDLRQRAEKGETEAMVQLALKTAPADRAGATAWVKKAAEQGHTQAMLLYAGEIAAKDKPGALQWIQKSADAGNLEAKYRLGVLYAQGQEVAPDMPHALKLFTESADGGFIPAQFDLGRSLVTGSPGLTADPARGIAYLKKVAARKDVVQFAAQAAAVLGELYERGVGAPANPGEALRWYRQAYSLGLKQVKPAVDRLSSAAAAAMKK